MSPDDRRPWGRSKDALDELAKRRQAVPVVPDPVQRERAGAVRFDPASLERPAVERQRIAAIPARLTPAAIRLLATAISDLAERLGGSLTSPPQFDTAYLPDGRVAITLTLVADVAALNEHAAELDPSTPR